MFTRRSIAAQLRRRFERLEVEVLRQVYNTNMPPASRAPFFRVLLFEACCQAACFQVSNEEPNFPPTPN